MPFFEILTTFNFQPRTRDLLEPCAFTMIFFTTFIFTIILSYVARAVPTCGDAAPPEELYEPYEVTFDAQSIILSNATWDIKYDNPNGDTNNVTCSSLAPQYPHFHDFPQFPYIGAAFYIWGPTCGMCWKLTNLKTQKSIYLFAIDYNPGGFKLGKDVFTAFTGGTAEVEVEATSISSSVCGFC